MSSRPVFKLEVSQIESRCITWCTTTFSAYKDICAKIVLEDCQKYVCQNVGNGLYSFLLLSVLLAGTVKWDVWLVCAYVSDGICLTHDVELQFEFGAPHAVTCEEWHISRCLPRAPGHFVHLKVLLWKLVQVSSFIYINKRSYFSVIFFSV